MSSSPVTFSWTCSFLLLKRETRVKFFQIYVIYGEGEDLLLWCLRQPLLCVRESLDHPKVSVLREILPELVRFPSTLHGN